METYQERLRRMIAEQMKEVDPTNIKQVQAIAAIQEAADNVIKESNEKLEESNSNYVKLAEAYKEAVTHQSFKPTEMEKATTTVGADGGLDELFQKLFGE